MKSLSGWYLATLMFVVLCLFALGSRAHDVGQQPRASKSLIRPTFDFERFTRGQPFRLNTLPTTPYGPAWADVLLEKSNFVECTGAPIALCYYSGSGPTTPCTLDGSGLANCTCYEIPRGQRYLVDINAILNRDVYLKTVSWCGQQGEKCRPTGAREAPVCKAINNHTLIPGAALVSAFSLYLEKQMHIDPTTCATPAAYAGCMTAPCKRTGNTDPTTGLPLVQCGCPTFTGPYQVGQKIAQDQCVLGGNNVWSAAYSPSPTPTPGTTALFLK